MEMQFNPITTQLDMVGGEDTGNRIILGQNNASFFALSDSAMLLWVKDIPIINPFTETPQEWPHEELVLPEGFVFSRHARVAVPLFVSDKNSKPLNHGPVGYISLNTNTRSAMLYMTAERESLPEGADELYCLPFLAHVRKTGAV